MQNLIVADTSEVSVESLSAIRLDRQMRQITIVHQFLKWRNVPSKTYDEVLGFDKKTLSKLKTGDTKLAAHHQFSISNGLQMPWWYIELLTDIPMSDEQLYQLYSDADWFKSMLPKFFLIPKHLRDQHFQTLHAAWHHHINALKLQSLALDATISTNT